MSHDNRFKTNYLITNLLKQIKIYSFFIWCKGTEFFVFYLFILFTYYSLPYRAHRTLWLLLFIARDNAILHKQENINRYVHVYFSDNTDITMELEGIDLMFSNQDVTPMPINDYREYMKQRKSEAEKGKR